MKELLQRVAAFLAHVIDAPESAPDTVDVARDLEIDVADAINANYVEPADDSEPTEEDDSD